MEELQSTEALDREILDDARKKAFKILKTADESAASSKTRWDEKLESALKGLRESYRLREEAEKHEIMARLPMDKRRVRSEKIEGFLSGAMDEFLAALDRKRLLALLEGELCRRLEASVDADAGACTIRYRGLSGAELDSLLKNRAAVRLSVLSKKEDALYAIKGTAPALVLDFPGLRITASADEAAREILLDKRAELAAALLGTASLDAVEAGGLS